jgi:hypothetical protein
MMDKGPQKTAFTMRDLRQAEVASKDNAQPRPQPPIHIQHPRLAPMGSVGVRVSQMPPPANQHAPAVTATKRPTLDREVGKPSEVNKEFKRLTRDPCDQTHVKCR